MCFTKYTDFRCAKCNHLLSWKTDHECYEHPGDPRKGCRIIIQRTDMLWSNKTCRKCKEKKKTKQAGRECVTKTWRGGGLDMNWKSVIQSQIWVNGRLLRDSPITRTFVEVNLSLSIVQFPLVWICYANFESDILRCDFVADKPGGWEAAVSELMYNAISVSEMVSNTNWMIATWAIAIRAFNVLYWKVQNWRGWRCCCSSAA